MIDALRAGSRQVLARWDLAGAAGSLYPALSLALPLLAVAVRTWQYVGNASLWLDEVELARNILQRPLIQLLTAPLVRDQVAPPGFLGLERLVVISLGDSDLALRLVPYLASLLSIPLFWSLSRRVLDEPARSMARAMFALSFAFIWYGSQVKQYSTDITIALGITLLALGLPERLARSGWPAFALIAGSLAGWFSNPALFVLSGVRIAHDPARARNTIVDYLLRIGTVCDSIVVPARLPAPLHPWCRSVPL